MVASAAATLDRVVTVERGKLTASRVGDLPGVPATGADRYTMANRYNGNRRIPVVFVADGLTSLAVRRETWADLLARDVD